MWPPEARATANAVLAFPTPPWAQRRCRLFGGGAALGATERAGIRYIEDGRAYIEFVAFSEPSRTDGLSLCRRSSARATASAIIWEARRILTGSRPHSVIRLTGGPYPPPPPPRPTGVCVCTGGYRGVDCEDPPEEEDEHLRRVLLTTVLPAAGVVARLAPPLRGDIKGP